MIQRVVRIAYPYGSVRRVMRGPARGLRFTVAPGIGFTYAWGTADAAPRHFEAWVRPGATVYDVGANKGQMALIFAALVGARGRVVSIEPAPHEFTSLKANIELNRLAHVHAIQGAAAEAAGELQFAYAADRPTQGKLTSVEQTYVNPGSSTFTVQATTLDDIAARDAMPDVIKIDVEGAGAAVLRGARRILDTKRPHVYIELHGPEEQAGVRDELVARGYTLHTLEGGTVADPVASWHTPLWCHPAGSR